MWLACCTYVVVKLSAVYPRLSRMRKRETLLCRCLCWNSPLAQSHGPGGRDLAVLRYRPGRLQDEPVESVVCSQGMEQGHAIQMASMPLPPVTIPRTITHTPTQTHTHIHCTHTLPLLHSVAGLAFGTVQCNDAAQHLRRVVQCDAAALHNEVKAPSNTPHTHTTYTLCSHIEQREINGSHAFWLMAQGIIAFAICEHVEIVV